MRLLIVVATVKEAEALGCTKAHVVVSGIGLATCFAPLHECGHRTAFRSKRLNDGVAWLMGLLSFYNSTFYRRYHQWHHRYTHQPAHHARRTLAYVRSPLGPFQKQQALRPIHAHGCT